MKRTAMALILSGGLIISGCGNIEPVRNLPACTYEQDEELDYDDLDPSDPRACYAPDDDKKKKKSLIKKAKSKKSKRR